MSNLEVYEVLRSRLKDFSYMHRELMQMFALSGVDDKDMEVRLNHVLDKIDDCMDRLNKIN